MTDKQIIIEGIDVSECEWYSSVYFKPCAGCKNTPNCYYKQLKRKEQELEQERTLKEMYFTYYKAKHSDIKGEFFKLKAENEKLKKILKELISEVEL